MERRVLAIWGFLVLLAASGCVGFVTGDPLRFDAAPAVESDDATVGTGYELKRQSVQRSNETITLLGRDRTVVLETHQAVYARVTEVNATTGKTTGDRPTPDASVVTVVSTPDARYLGQSVNPLARLSNRELLGRFRGDVLGSASNLTLVDRRSVTMLETETRLSVFEGNAAGPRNETRPTRIYVAKVPHEGDVVIFIGIHPTSMDDEEPRIVRLVEGVEHPED